MNKIFRKAMTVLGSAALIGMTVGSAAAASYPSPFTSNSAIVYGSGVAMADMAAVTDIAESIDESTAVSAGGVVETTEGDVVSLDNDGSRIYLNKSLNGVNSQFTKTQLPVLLADTTFSGNVDATISSKILIGDGATGGADNSNMVIFSKQPKTSLDPSIGVSLGTSATNYLYNATATFKNINFSSTDSEGESITLFGRDFIVSTATDTDTLVLFSSAKQVNLNAGGASPNPSETVVIDGTSYEVELVTGSNTGATIAVNGVSKEIDEGSSKKVNGLDIAVKSVTESTALSTIDAAILVGANKMTFNNGQKVTEGSDDLSIDGTNVYFGGTPGTLGMTELTVQVFRTGTSEDAILAGDSFTDPVFGSFKVDFAGLNYPLDDTDNRDSIIIKNAGDKTMTLEMTDSADFHTTVDFAFNVSGSNYLMDENNYTIHVIEMANVTEEEYVFLGNEDYGHLLKVDSITNGSAANGAGDSIKLYDMFTGLTHTTEDTSNEGSATLNLDGKAYTITYDVMSSDAGTIQINTADSATADTFVVYPTMKTAKGANVALYEPLALTLGNTDGAGVSTSTTLRFPDGDGYTDVVFSTKAGEDGNWTTTVGGVAGTDVSTDAAADAATYSWDFTIGQLVYSIEAVGTTGLNTTMLYLNSPEDDTTNIVGPAVVIFEEKDDNNEYHTLVVSTERANAGTGSSGIGVEDVYVSSDYYHASATLASDSDITQDIDWWGTLITKNADDSDQTFVTISYPDAQVYAQLYVGETGSSVGTTPSVNVKTYADTETASFAGMNLVVVGGSAINAIAAELLGSAYSEGDFTAATGIAAGEFLIKSYDRSGKTALLVAGYNAADTEKAAKVLLNEVIDTSVGKEYKGVSSTEAITSMA